LIASAFTFSRLDIHLFSILFIIYYFYLFTLPTPLSFQEGGKKNGGGWML
jgi:hypothetical protein